MAKKQTAADRIRKLQQQLSQANATIETLSQQRDSLNQVQGASRQRIADLEQRLSIAEEKLYAAEQEAAANLEDVQRDAEEAKGDFHHARGLAEGRQEAMEMLGRLVAQAPSNLKPLIAENRSEREPSMQRGSLSLGDLMGASAELESLGFLRHMLSGLRGNGEGVGSRVGG
jgi:chromosome segregation ATPase